MAPLKQGDCLPSNPLRWMERLAFDRQLLSYCQTAEWGMRALQGAFGQLRVPLDVDPGCRFLLLKVIAQAHNLLVDFNEICSVYCDIWRQADEDATWAGFASMMFGELCRNDQVARFHTIAVAQEEEQEEV